MNSLIIPTSLRRNLEQLNSTISVGTNNKHKANANTHKESNHIDGARAEIEEMFDEDSYDLASRLKRSVPGRSRITGTSKSSQSKELFIDSHVGDYNGEVFDRGDEPFGQQWDEINREYNLNRRQTKEVFEVSDIDDVA